MSPHKRRERKWSFVVFLPVIRITIKRRRKFQLSHLCSRRSIFWPQMRRKWRQLNTPCRGCRKQHRPNPPSRETFLCVRPALVFTHTSFLLIIYKPSSVNHRSWFRPTHPPTLSPPHPSCTPLHLPLTFPCFCPHSPLIKYDITLPFMADAKVKMAFSD